MCQDLLNKHNTLHVTIQLSVCIRTTISTKCKPAHWAKSHSNHITTTNSTWLHWIYTYIKHPTVNNFQSVYFISHLFIHYKGHFSVIVCDLAYKYNILIWLSKNPSIYPLFIIIHILKQKNRNNNKTNMTAT